MTAALAIALAALGAVPKAAPLAKRAPVRVDADQVQYAFQKREVTFLGADSKPVTMTRDDATLTCRRLVAKTDDAGEIVSAACVGDVRFARGVRVVTCARATFEAAADRIVCEGDPVLREGGTEARGSRLVYDLRSDEAKLDDAIVIVPEQQAEEHRRRIEQRRKERKP